VLDYMKRLQRMATVEWKILRSGKPVRQTSEEMLAASEGALRVVLDERGRQLTSREFAQWIGRQELAGRKAVSVLIGGADGHDAGVREAADEMWALSAMTLQHELALVVFLEQLYRARSIQAGSPYHRD
jgi:23S rRNA (pseudouridine1915-N3)-methyltransferase